MQPELTRSRGERDRADREVQRPMAYKSLLGLVALFAVLVWISKLFGDALPEPYMDEIFHIPQAQAFCRHFPRVAGVKYDAKITTFPGIYLVSALASALTRIFTITSSDYLGGECSIGFLRMVNPVLAGIGACIMYRLVTQVRRDTEMQARRIGLRETSVHERRGEKREPDDGSQSLVDVALAIGFPLHAFFVWLYYTDTASTVSVLATWLALIKKRYILSGILGGCSILMRQTNAVWVICLVGWDIADAALATQGSATERKATDREMVASKVARQASGPSSRTADLGAQVTAVARYMRSNIATCIRQYGVHAAVVAMFAFFVFWNGGVVVGDRANHIPVQHWVQPFYFYAYFVISTAPMWLGRLKRDILSLRDLQSTRSSRGAKGIAGSLGLGIRRGAIHWVALLFALSVSAIGWGTLVHPFILADNRHYTFYIWRRVLGASDWSRYVAAPVYTLCVWLALYSPPLDQPTIPVIKTVMLAFCTVVVLVPAHLVEFRYFTVPWYLHVLRPGSVLYDDQRRDMTPLKLITLLGYIALNTATIYVFLYRSFLWADGSVARFCW